MKTGTSLQDLNDFKVPIDPFLSLIDMPWPCPQNRVIVTSFGTTFNHKQAVGMISGASFKNCRLSAYTARFYDPGQFVEPTGQGFTSGLYVSMGTNSERVSLLFIHIFRGIISNIPNLPRRPRNTPMFVCNKVSSGVYDPLDIHNFEKNDGTRVVRHKKSFSGIIYRCLIRFDSQNVKQVSISIFKSGNYIVMNVEGMEALIAFIYFLPILHRNKLNKVAKPTADQLITFVRQEYINFDPEKESIIECVKRAIANAEKSVITREEIIQKAIQNATMVRNNSTQQPSSSSSSVPEIEEVIDDDDDEMGGLEIGIEEVVEDDVVVEDEEVIIESGDEAIEIATSEESDYDSDILDLYEKEHWSQSDNEENYDVEGYVGSEIDDHAMVSSSSTSLSNSSFPPPDINNDDKNKRQRKH
jgi:hypothetical protein